jgi:hypothetical protein
MRKFVLFAAVLAISSPSLAFAGDVQKSKTAIKATQMSDAEMDKVTAGEAPSVSYVIDFKVGQAPDVVYVPNQVPDHQTKFDSYATTPSSPGAVR